MNKQPLVILTGPTGVGKSAFSIDLAKRIGGQIISADSMQVYRGMDVGTAKIMPDEMDGIRHYGIDICDPTENYNVTEFVSMAKAAVSKIYENGSIPIIVGGTGFYIQALLYDIEFSDEPEDLSVREELTAFAAEHGAAALHEKLKDIDPVSYETIHPNNIKRNIRAIEYYMHSGCPISDHNSKQHEKESAFLHAYFVMTRDRAQLYENIDRRVDIMMDDGLLDEARHIYDSVPDRSLTSMQAIGYKQLFEYFDGNCSLEDAVSNIKKESRHYAKRQLTWFRRERDVIWLDRSIMNNDEIMDRMLGVLKERGITF